MVKKSWSYSAKWQYADSFSSLKNSLPSYPRMLNISLFFHSCKSSRRTYLNFTSKWDPAFWSWQFFDGPHGCQKTFSLGKSKFVSIILKKAVGLTGVDDLSYFKVCTSMELLQFEMSNISTPRIFSNQWVQPGKHN